MVEYIQAVVTGSVWQIVVGPGHRVETGETVVLLESMKMEIPVEAESSGTVRDILVTEGQSVTEGDNLLILETDG